VDTGFLIKQSNSKLGNRRLKSRDGDLLPPQESIFLALDKNSNGKLRIFLVPYCISVFSRTAEPEGGEGWVNDRNYLWVHYIRGITTSEK
jgi:hypothetical protein